MKKYALWIALAAVCAVLTLWPLLHNAAPEEDSRLILNVLPDCQIPMREYEPLPYEPLTAPLGTAELEALFPGIPAQSGEAHYSPEGILLRILLEIPAEGTVIRLSAAPNLYASDLPPAYRVDDPGEGQVTWIGKTQCLAMGLPVRAPRGTGWRIEVLLRSSDMDYQLTASAAPGQDEALLSTLEALIHQLDRNHTPDLTSLRMEFGAE